MKALKSYMQSNFRLVWVNSTDKENQQVVWGQYRVQYLQHGNVNLYRLKWCETMPKTIEYAEKQNLARAFG